MTTHHDALTLGSKLERTREGFLLCKDVVIARTGTQDYRAFEVPLPAGPGGVVQVDRPESEVFDQAAIDSFRGKPLTDDHPWEDVDPKNYKDHLIGTILDPRRGSGQDADKLVSDILVYDAKSIDKILKEGKRELSCGYDADYRDVRPGYGVQTNIRGNHVSLVDQGRCGAACAIKDRSMYVAREVKKPVLSQKFVDALRGVLKAKVNDEDIEPHMEKLDDAVEEMDRPDGSESEGGDNHHHVTVNIGGQEAPRGDKTPTTDEEPGEETAAGEDDTMCSKADLDAALAAATAPLMAQIDALKSQMAEMADDMGSEMDPDDVSTQDAVARAEVLKPGYKLPALDAKPGSKSHRDALVGAKRRVLAESWATADGRRAIAEVYGRGTPDFGKMGTGEVELVFRNASQAMRDSVMSKQADSFLMTSTAGVVRDADGTKRVLDSRSYGDIIRKHYGRTAA